MIINNPSSIRNTILTTPSGPSVKPITNDQRIKNIIKEQSKDYTKDKLLEDILKLFEEQKKTATTNYATSINFIENQIKAKVNPKLDEWLKLWQEAFSKNPTADLSSLISGIVSDELNKGAGIKSQIYNDWGNQDGALAQKIYDSLEKDLKTKFMSVPKFNLGLDKIGDSLNTEITNILAGLNLDTSSKGIDAFLALKDKAWAGVANAFKSLKYLNDDNTRPYRVIDNVDTFSKGLFQQFDNDYHNSKIATTLVKAASDKASEELDSIMKFISINETDSRTMNVLNQLMKGKTFIANDPLTTNVLNTLLGAGNAKRINDWASKWSNILSLSLSLDNTSGPGKTKLVFKSTLNKNTVIFKRVSSPDTDIVIDQKMIDTIGSLTVQKTSAVPEYDIEYIADKALEEYKKWFAVQDLKDVIRQDDYLNFFSGKPKESQCSKDGFKYSGLSLDDIDKISHKLYLSLTQVKSDATNLVNAFFSLNNNAELSNYMSKLKLLFDISFVIKDGVSRLVISPTIKDAGIDNLPTTALLNYFDHAEVKRLYNDIDKTHEERKSPVVQSIVRRISSPLDEEADKIWRLFNKAGPVEIFEKEFPGNKVAGEDVSLDYIINKFPSLGAELNQFRSKTYRFKIKFDIKEISGDGIIVEYSLTDSKVGSSTVVNNPEDKHLLDNVIFNFSKSANRAQAILEKLQNSQRGDVDLFDDRDGVRSFSWREKPLVTDSEIDAYFKEFQKIKQEGLSGPIKIKLEPVRDDGFNGVVTTLDEDGDTLSIQQVFRASYTVGTKTIVEELAIPISKVYLSDQTIDNYLDSLDTEFNNIFTLISDSKLNEDDKLKLLSMYSEWKEKIEGEINADRDELTQEVLSRYQNEASLLNAGINKAVNNYDVADEAKDFISKNFDQAFEAIEKSDLTEEYKDDLTQIYLLDEARYINAINDNWYSISKKELEEYKSASEQYLKDAKDAVLKYDTVNHIKDNIEPNFKAATDEVSKSSIDDEAKKQIQDYLDWSKDFINKEMNYLGWDATTEQLSWFKDAVDEIADQTLLLIRMEYIKSIQGPLQDEFKGDVPDEVEKLFLSHPELFQQLLKNNPEILHNLKELRKACENWDKNLPMDAFFQAQKSLQISGKYTLLALGSLLGFGALLGMANSGKIATTNKKASSSSRGKIKSSKKLAFISAFIGLASAAGSVVTFIYLFIVQGGL